MRRALPTLLCLLFLASFACNLPAQELSRPPGKNVILIGWDGAQRAHVRECMERGELPALKALVEEGAFVDIDVITGATDTKAGWTQILTGYHPEVTGVYSNGRYRDVPAGLSIFERLKKQFGPDFVCVAVIGKRGNVGEVLPPTKRELSEEEAALILKLQQEARQREKARKAAKAQAASSGVQEEQPAAQIDRQARQQQRALRRALQLPADKAERETARRQAIRGQIVEEAGKKYLVFGGSPYYTMHKVCDVWEYGLVEDAKVGSRTIELLEKYKDRPFFFFVHFASVDANGHRYGENSKEYNDALISNDLWTGKIIAKLKELGLYDRTLIYVTADHGFNEGERGHSYAPFIFLATNDPAVKRAGMRQDIAPTILDRMGVNLSKIEPPLDGEPLTKPATKPVLKAPEKPPAPKAAFKAKASPQKDPAPRKKRFAPAPA
ncbi:MAG: alkaline phosphatase family protein [Thermoguttaceae bacterium]|nr:alkaline phosphatase family protein [Thermoguttaceae bacterium]MDW8079439.1 alkaline phosphatase family protein [Thermoguttaceae bacterium]